MKPLPLTTAILVLLSAAPPGLLADEPPPTPDRVEITSGLIDRLVAEARSRNPALQAAEARTEAAAAAAAAVRTWEDPTASFGLWDSTPRGMPASQEGNLVYGLDEKLPLYGRPDLARKIAAAGATRSQLAAEYETQKLRLDLQVSLDGLAISGREEEIAEEDLAWLGATLAAVDHRYRVGQASQVDWLRIQSARAVAGNDLKNREHDRDHSVLALNRLLNRDLHASWPRVSIPPAGPPIYYTSRLVDAALAAEPEIRVMRQESASAEAAAELTRSMRLPDVSVGFEARQYSGDAGFREGTATVSFSVPWLNRGRYDDDWRRDRQLKRASDLAAADYALSVREELHHDILDLDAARRQALLYRDQLIPLATQTIASAQVEWERNLGSFQDLLDTHRMLLADELALDQALVKQNTLLAQISFVTKSRDLGTLVDLAGSPPSDREDSPPDTTK